MGCFIGVVIIAAVVAVGVIGTGCLKGKCKKDDEESKEK